MFNLPTLVTITAPTCAGKSYLLEELCRNGFDRIVSTTDRAKRQGEVEGVHYNFISTERSKELEANDEFAELITYNGTRYGVTKAEMRTKMAAEKPPIVILEPQGIAEYRKYCSANGYTMFSIYIETPEPVRLNRLIARTTGDIVAALWIADVTRATVASQAAAIQKIIGTNNHRLKAVLEDERQWSHTNRWDAIVDGTDTKRALAQIHQNIKSRNSRADIFK